MGSSIHAMVAETTGGTALISPSSPEGASIGRETEREKLGL